MTQTAEAINHIAEAINVVVADDTATSKTTREGGEVRWWGKSGTKAQMEALYKAMLKCRACTTCEVVKEKCEVTGKTIHVLYVVAEDNFHAYIGVTEFIKGWCVAKGYE